MVVRASCRHRTAYHCQSVAIDINPPPFSAPCAADEVAAATEAGSKAESFVIVKCDDCSRAPIADRVEIAMPSPSHCVRVIFSWAESNTYSPETRVQ
jgi:hypothetical protein